MFNRIFIALLLLSFNGFSDCMPKSDNEKYNSADFMVEGIYLKSEKKF